MAEITTEAQAQQAEQKLAAFRAQQAREAWEAERDRRAAALEVLSGAQAMAEKVKDLLPEVDAVRDGLPAEERGLAVLLDNLVTVATAVQDRVARRVADLQPPPDPAPTPSPDPVPPSGA